MTTPQELLIVGAGGLGREAVATVRAMNAVRPTFTPLGFLDDDPDRAGTKVDGLEVLGPIDPFGRSRIADFPDAQVVVCAGSAHARFNRLRIVARLQLPADRYATVVHPTAVLPDGLVVGPGCVILATVVVTTAIEIGAHVVMMPGVTVAHDGTVGSFVTFGSGARLAGGVVVDDGAYLGAGALVREGCRIGAWSLVGMGAVVLSDIPPGEAWVGNPARRLRSLDLPE